MKNEKEKTVNISQVETAIELLGMDLKSITRKLEFIQSRLLVIQNSLKEIEGE